MGPSCAHRCARRAWRGHAADYRCVASTQSPEHWRLTASNFLQNANGVGVGLRRRIGGRARGSGGDRCDTRTYRDTRGDTSPVRPIISTADRNISAHRDVTLKVGPVEIGAVDVSTVDVSLHEEHAEVLRRAITDPKYIGDIDWADATIEVRETAEQALVSKTARVVEEVRLKKLGSDHVETVHYKIRRQQVEIERLGADGRPLTAPRA